MLLGAVEKSDKYALGTQDGIGQILEKRLNPTPDRYATYLFEEQHLYV
jgi:hypothetical protein